MWTKTLTVSKKFLARNYPEQLIQEQFDRALAKDRADLLRTKRCLHDSVPVQTNMLRKKVLITSFIITFNKVKPPVQKWLEE